VSTPKHATPGSAPCCHANRRPAPPSAQHAGTIRVQDTLRPFAVAMAGEGEFDPFKD